MKGGGGLAEYLHRDSRWENIKEMNGNIFTIRFHWDALNIILTSLAVAGALLIYSMVMTIGLPLAYILASVFLLYIMLSALFVPYRIKLRGDVLVIRKLAGKHTIPLDSIVSARQLPDDFMETASKLFGSNGFCGYWGKYLSPYTGSFILCATERKNLIMVTMTSPKTGTEKRIVFSCRDKNVITALNKDND